jgi:hypothetical protein
MLTLDAILKATKQMTSYGEKGTPGALDHLPAKLQGQPSERGPTYRNQSTVAGEEPARVWDDEKKVYRSE